jgi:hypothetical protein
MNNSAFRWQGNGPLVTPLVPEDGLYLWDWGKLIDSHSKLRFATARFTNRFVKSFQKTWGQIPERDRNTLTDFWGSKKEREPTVRWLPAIEFHSFSLPPTFAGACTVGGFELLFSVDYLQRKSSGYVSNTIAHELGHAMSHIHGWYRQHECKARFGECVACEFRTYSYMEAWGFDPLAGVIPKRRTKSLIDRLTQG